MNRIDCFNMLNILIKTLNMKIEYTTPTERKICFATLLSKGIEPELNNLKISTEQMKEIYEVVNINSLEPTISCHGMIRTIFDHNFDVSITYK